MNKIVIDVAKKKVENFVGRLEVKGDLELICEGSNKIEFIASTSNPESISSNKIKDGSNIHICISSFFFLSPPLIPTLIE